MKKRLCIQMPTLLLLDEEYTKDSTWLTIFSTSHEKVKRIDRAAYIKLEHKQ